MGTFEDLELADVVRAAGLESASGDAWREIVNRFETSSLQAAARMLGDQHLAADAVQQAFVEAFTTLDQLREPAAFPGWFRCIVVKQADRVRRRLPRREIPLPDHGFLDQSVGPEDHLIAALEREAAAEAVRSALDELDAKDREILRLRYVTQLPGSAIAAATGLSPGAARKRLHDARRRLRTIFHQQQGATMTTNLLGAVLDLDDPRLDELPAATPGERGNHVVSTGIKVIDTMAPILRGGTFELSGPAGCGQLVTALEIAHNLVERSDWAVVFAFDAGQVLDDLVAEIERTGVLSRAVVVRGAGGAAAAAAADVGVALRAQGLDVLLVADDADGAAAAASANAGVAGEGSLTVGLFSPTAAGSDQRTLAGADTDLVFSAFLAVQRHYPAINVVRSRSRAIEEGLVPAADVEAATEVRDLVHRATRLQSYLAQSLRVAEPHVGVPGEVIERDDALSQLEQLLRGSLDAPTDDELRTAVEAAWSVRARG